MKSKLREDIKALMEECGCKGGVVSVPTPLGPSRTIRDLFFDLMDTIVSDIRVLSDMSENDAFEAAADVADEMTERGLLPPFPHDEMNDAEIARWVNAASYSDFRKQVMQSL